MLSSMAHAQTFKQQWQHPSNDYRVKTWWFFGYEHTTDEGITADVEALSKAGFGGVVYYDQNHRRPATTGDAFPRKNAKNLPNGTPDEGFSPAWWHHLRFAASEARRVGLSFEMNISNGYCAGGRWIDTEHAMQRVACGKTRVSGGQEVSIDLPTISGPEDYVKDIAVLAVPYRGDGLMRHITARYVARGKGRNGAMQGPGLVGDDGNFSGYGFKALPDVGTLQVSDDSISWRDVVTLQPMYRSQGVYPVRTNAFPATTGRYWRIRHNDGTSNYEGQASGDIREWRVGDEALLDCWEERTALQSDFAEQDCARRFSRQEGIAPSEVIDITDKVEGDSLLWDAPAGEWTILRLAAVLTGAKSKHGRDNLLGYECDKLSAEAANLHWDNYAQVILDSINASSVAGEFNPPLIQGITMDSHEGGSQNWTPRMLEEFRTRRGYDFRPWLPTLAGYVMESEERTQQVLYDYRLTIADCIRDNYFGTFQRRAAENGLPFTAQAIGNALCITGDAISVKQAVEKPQGEFWTYQRDGAYDVKDCSSAAHLYGKPIASAEAMTDCEYKNTPADLHRVCNIALSMGAQEFVVCATPHIPVVGGFPADAPYVAGREYAINRSNPRWHDMKPVWEQAARSMVLLRQGVAAPDVLVYLGDDIPMKILTNRLPKGLDGLDWDACTGDALKLLTLRNNQLVTEGGVAYKALLIGKEAMVTGESQQLIETCRAAGFPILLSGESIPRTLTIEQGADSVVFTHRHIDNEELFYLASKENRETSVRFRLQDHPSKVTVWHNATGKRTTLKSHSDGLFEIQLKPVESVCITY